jgi:hypothetical protein
MTGGMSGWREDDLESFEAELGRDELSPEGIAETNRHLVERQALFRRAADVATAALAGFDEVLAVALFGSVASSLWKEVPRFSCYRRAGIALWHECAVADIAVWLSRLDRLREMRRRVNRALLVILEESGLGCPSIERRVRSAGVVMLDSGGNPGAGLRAGLEGLEIDALVLELHLPPSEERLSKVIKAIARNHHDANQGAQLKTSPKLSWLGFLMRTQVGLSELIPFLTVAGRRATDWREIHGTSWGRARCQKERGLCLTRNNLRRASCES